MQKKEIKKGNYTAIIMGYNPGKRGGEPNTFTAAIEHGKGETMVTISNSPTYKTEKGAERWVNQKLATV